MIKDIDSLVNTDVFEEWDCKANLPNQDKFTQEEIKQIVGILGRVYRISHCLTCKACQTKYLTPTRE
jgi:hypothetical protein